MLLRGYGLMTLPINLFGADDEPHAVSDAFKATLVGVAEAASEAADRLASARLPRGRPRKNDPFRELVIHLIRKYERLTHEPAGCPYWLPDSGIYGGKGRFWKFACAVWRCLYHHGPELRPVLPDTEEALGQELRKHWPSSETGNNSLDCD